MFCDVLFKLSWEGMTTGVETFRAGLARRKNRICVGSPALAMRSRTDELHQQLKSPRAAAIAGILFSVLTISTQLLIQRSVTANPTVSAAEVLNHSKTILLALNLVPFAGIAFLWFIGVFRDHVGEHEDRLFASVFLGSGLLYVAMLFASAALAGGLLGVIGNGAEHLVSSGSYALTRMEIRQITAVYAIRMAGVFVITTSTISLRTRVMPRWLALLGYLAAVVLLAAGAGDWSPLVFPAWVFIISIWILVQRFQEKGDGIKT